MDNPAINIAPPEPPTEILYLVLRAAPAMQEVQASLARFGYAHTEAGALSDTEIAAARLLMVRGLMVDTLFDAETREGQTAYRASCR
jgi:hypothetical protein